MLRVKWLSEITYREIQASLGIDMKEIRFCMIIWAYGNFAVIGSHTIWPKLKNRLVLNGAKKCSKNSTEVGQIWSPTSLLGTKHGSIRMSPKVNNNPLFEYFKMNRNQQKLFVHAFAAKQMIACFLYRTCDNRGFRGSKDCKYWLIYNNLFARSHK